MSLLVLSGAVTDMRPHTLAKCASSVFTRLPFFTSNTKMYFLTPAHKNSFLREKRHRLASELLFGIFLIPVAIKKSERCE